MAAWSVWTDNRRHPSNFRNSPGDRRVGSSLKQVIVVNEALRLPCGKLAVQVAHAAIGAFLEARRDDQVEWLTSGMAKVVLACESQSALQALHELALQAGLPVFLVADAGRTVIPGGTVTCLGIGPALERAIGPLTGALKLLP